MAGEGLLKPHLCVLRANSLISVPQIYWILSGTRWHELTLRAFFIQTEPFKMLSSFNLARILVLQMESFEGKVR